MNSIFFHLVNIYFCHDNLVDIFHHLNNSVDSPLKHVQRFGSKLHHQIEHTKIDSNSDFNFDILLFDQYFSSPRQFNEYFSPLKQFSWHFSLLKQFQRFGLKLDHWIWKIKIDSNLFLSSTFVYLVNIFLCYDNSINIVCYLNNSIDFFAIKIIFTVWIKAWLSDNKY